MSLGMMKKSRRLQSKREDKFDSLPGAPIIQVADETCMNEENSLSELDSLREEEKQLLLQKRQLLEILGQVQFKFDSVTDRRSHLMAEMEKNLSLKQQESEKGSHFKLFLVETGGSSFNDGLVFTVMAEDHVWAEGLVREWLEAYGKDTDKIDTVRAVLSRDVRAIVNVASKLLAI